ncbi:MAG TPA: SprT-like domain-containing protein [Candidatus Eisenbacteria bacterium]|nr:SprT-like domain-containing protein [Candidatus Eisenbacteria bacterium]
MQSKNPALITETVQTAITAVEYGTFQNAYDHFNAALFGGRLPQVLITFQRRSRVRGYFSPERFQSRNEKNEVIHEIALNPDEFPERSDEGVLSTLVHEMAHVWQQEYGRPGRGRYHNREWAVLMHSIGLMPSATGEPGGAATGDHVSHYILKDGLFLSACRTFLEKYRLIWESSGMQRGRQSGTQAGLEGTMQPLENGNATEHTQGAIRKTQTRSKFTCPICGLNGWAKPDAQMDCHVCSAEVGEAIMMCPEEQ